MRDSANSTSHGLPKNRSLVVIYDQTSPCPYLPELQARMPLEWPQGNVGADQFDDLMASGYRRSGLYYYRPQCPTCQACESTRIDVRKYVPSKSMRRILHRGDRLLQVVWRQPSFDTERLQLVNAHRNQRGLATNDSLLTEDDYDGFLVHTQCDTRELACFLDGRLVANGVVDLGKTCLSAVYCFFDPDQSRLSLGSYNILKLCEFARETGRQYLYLGMYVAANRHLNYKGRFLPQERLIAGQWVEISKP